MALFGTFPLAPVSAWHRAFPMPFPSRSRRCVLVVMLALSVGCGGFTVTPDMQADAAESRDVLTAVVGAGVLPNDPAVVSGLQAAGNMVVALGDPPLTDRRAVTLGAVPGLVSPPPGATAEEVRRIVEAGQARAAADAEAAAERRARGILDGVVEAVGAVAEPASDVPGLVGVIGSVLAALAAGFVAWRRGRGLAAIVQGVEQSTVSKDLVRTSIARVTERWGVGALVARAVKRLTEPKK